MVPETDTTDTVAVDATPAPPPPPPMHYLPPDVLVAPSGRILPAGVIYSRSGLDTGGGVLEDLRIGLGDVAEFGVATTELVRGRNTSNDKYRRIAPYITASFTMGVSENRLFQGQPALALGYRKSFERSTDGATTRAAELHLAATKTIGDRTTIHVGGVFWDASLAEGPMTYTLHGGSIGRQLRPYGGLEVRPLPDAEILIDVYWAPQFCYQCTTKDSQIGLGAVLSWGVRYRVTNSVNIESGVKVQDIASANLLEAQIFGNLSFFNSRIRRAIDR